MSSSPVSQGSDSMFVEHESNSGSASGQRQPSSQFNKKGKPLANPRKPNGRQLPYDTQHYPLYDPDLQNFGPQVTERFKPKRDYSLYDQWSLFVWSLLNLMLTKANFESMIPPWGVRLDDEAAAFALDNYALTFLTERWPAEFDSNGIIRAGRVPLGGAYKIYVQAGEVDVDGILCTDPGWYYGWWRGIHCMMGDEGYQADMYWVRPSHENFKCKGFGFRVATKP
ncbi:hypothetical protein MMC13_000623 [Lambiella insularis]|nr:hypothetical protein [Lambiella insularis]